MASAIQYINPNGLHDPSHYGYTHAIVVPANTTLVYIAGQLGEDETGNPVSADFAAQLKQEERKSSHGFSGGWGNARTRRENYGALGRSQRRETTIDLNRTQCNVERRSQTCQHSHSGTETGG